MPPARRPPPGTERPRPAAGACRHRRDAADHLPHRARDIPMSVRAMKAGAVEFLTKPFREQDLLDAIRHAIERDRALRTERQELTELRGRYASLTRRERDVLARIVAGLLNKQIAGELGTTEATVKEQRAHVMAKMQAGSVADLVRFAARLGITPAGSGSNPPETGEGSPPPTEGRSLPARAPARPAKGSTPTVA